jgi:aspartyl-tRNA(Asn)/glutamyl-tRNA(Gln) amidotransferase subunit C
MAITHDQVRWVAHLSRLELTPAEIESLARELGAIVEYVNQLQALNTDGVEPLAHPIDVHNVFRADEPAPSLAVESVLANAPKRKDDFYAVPAVLD